MENLSNEAGKRGLSISKIPAVFGLFSSAEIKIAGNFPLWIQILDPGQLRDGAFIQACAQQPGNGER